MERSVFPAGRGRGNPSLSTVNSGSSRSYALVTVSDKCDGAYVDSCTTRYTRMKLLDILRMTDISNCRMLLKDFVDIPSLTVGEPLEPLALSALAPEESVILKGIEKGDIISSGLPQYSKDGSVGRRTDEDWPSAVDDDRDDTTDHGQGTSPHSHLDI
ncbi:hypothetical protein J5N97_024714 [Dioscorea zingiberensis]|uniref:Uncharacterized protein n=1 Tax=Dioscorea zingiberensis TaxID=325984 RepID=A0A9D5C8E7_9LILI|nr:hypothetical protein J5N97_024714 [Dioscorea zingiberensis]